MRLLLTVCATFVLTGCIQPTISLPGSTPPPDIVAPTAPAPAPAALTKCPPKVNYSQQQLDDFAAALAALDAAKLQGYRVIDGFLTDYHNMRDADDVCIKAPQ